MNSIAYLVTRMISYYDGVSTKERYTVIGVFSDRDTAYRIKDSETHDSAYRRIIEEHPNSYFEEIKVIPIRLDSRVSRIRDEALIGLSRR